MRIMQLIDSLEAGGAERMAVHYANRLSEEIEFSGLVSTRKKGPLLGQLDQKVSYFFLNKKNTLDLKAFWSLRQYIVDNKVDFVQAHSTSFFMALVVKLFCPSVQLIWHDHYGDSEFLGARSKLQYRLGLPFYKGVISVNQKLKDWTVQSLAFKNVIYLPNFSSLSKAAGNNTVLKGLKGKRIVSLANLRPQKNHLLLLQVAKRVQESHPDWTFHLIGKNFEDPYASQIKKTIVDKGLKEHVFMYGSKEDVQNILSQSTIGVLTSASEGLPLALLEYGAAKIPVVVTQVGEIPSVVQNNSSGFLVPLDDQVFYEKLVVLMEDDRKQAVFAEALSRTITEQFGEEQVIQQYLNWLPKRTT